MNCFTLQGRYSRILKCAWFFLNSRVSFVARTGFTKQVPNKQAGQDKNLSGKYFRQLDEDETDKLTCL